MLRLNHCSRYTIADLAVLHIAASDPTHPIAPEAHLLASNWRHELRKHDKFTREYGVDPDWCAEIPVIQEGK